MNAIARIVNNKFVLPIAIACKSLETLPKPALAKMSF
jgi:hypothetical protein